MRAEQRPMTRVDIQYLPISGAFGTVSPALPLRNIEDRRYVVWSPAAPL
jgi:hypothetical protein